MDLALDCVEGDGIVRCIWCEDRDCGARGEGVDGGFVGFGVAFVVRGVGFEGSVKAIVNFGDVFVEMFAWISLSALLSSCPALWGLSCERRGVRMAGYFDPEVPTIDSFPTFPRRRKSNIVKPTTPTFLSEPEAPPPTNPVVYSPVPTIRTSNGLDATCWAAGAGSFEPCIGIESMLS